MRESKGNNVLLTPWGEQNIIAFAFPHGKAIFYWFLLSLTGKQNIIALPTGKGRLLFALIINKQKLIHHLQYYGYISLSKSVTILFAESSLSINEIFDDLLEIQGFWSFACFSTLKNSLFFVCSLSNHSW